jgi:hypothetical protein
LGQAVYLSRVWHVKPGREDEFRRRWRDGVDDLARQLPGVTFRLWRDAEHPGRFHSIGGPAESDVLDAIRGSASFRRNMDAVAEVLEDVEISALELVEEIG